MVFKKDDLVVVGDGGDVSCWGRVVSVVLPIVASWSTDVDGDAAAAAASVGGGAAAAVNCDPVVA
ncbi:MAG: hypothetical protein ACK53X_00585 [Holosporales bacterium]